MQELLTGKPDVLRMLQMIKHYEQTMMPPTSPALKEVRQMYFSQQMTDSSKKPKKTLN